MSTFGWSYKAKEHPCAANPQGGEQRGAGSAAAGLQADDLAALARHKQNHTRGSADALSEAKRFRCDKRARLYLGNLPQHVSAYVCVCTGMCVCAGLVCALRPSDSDTCDP